MSDKLFMEDDPDNEEENKQGSDKRQPDSEQGHSVSDTPGNSGAASENRTGQGPSTLGGGMSRSGGSTGDAGGASQGGGTGND